jgi:tRNA(Ile)-lysidine synthase
LTVAARIAMEAHIAMETPPSSPARRARAARASRLDPAVAATRVAVRRALAELPGDALVLVGCSGGPDSLALAAATAFEAPKLGLRAGAITVDHGLQAGSADQALAAKSVLGELGLHPVLAVRVAVDGHRGSGPEAAARHARYAAFAVALEQAGASAILLGHTMDDQAETVLLGLARGSGARSIAAMAGVSGPYLRPLLGLRRAQTVAACAAQGLAAWSDPQNSDPAYSRTRVRTRILPLMEELIGPGVTESLARTADQLRADADLLDSLALERAGPLLASWAGAGPRSVEVGELAVLPGAIRTRVLKRAAIRAGVPAGAITAAHVAEIDALVTHWHGQHWIDLPGGIRCQRRYGRLHFTDSR